MAHYLITGGCGFIGSHLVERLLASGHELRILDDLSTGRLDNVPSGLDVRVADMRRKEVIDEALVGVDAVFHLAAVASVTRCNEAWLETHGINLGATIGLFDACRRSRHPQPVVYASSAAVYGDQLEMPLHEGLAPAPLNPYGADKAACELHARAAARIHGLRTFGLRFFNVFGTRQPANDSYAGVITTFLHRARAGLPMTIHGDGLQTRDFVHVGDVTECLARAMAWLQSRTEPCAEIANVASGQPTSIRDLAQLVAQRSDRDLAVQHGPERAGEIRHSLGSADRLDRLLGYRPRLSVESGLASMV